MHGFRLRAARGWHPAPDPAHLTTQTLPLEPRWQPIPAVRQRTPRPASPTTPSSGHGIRQGSKPDYRTFASMTCATRSVPRRWRLVWTCTQSGRSPVTRTTSPPSDTPTLLTIPCGRQWNDPPPTSTLIGRTLEVRHMAFETGTDRLTCPSCGAQHDADWHRMPVKEHQICRCHLCFAALVQGRSVKDYVRVTLVTD